MEKAKNKIILKNITKSFNSQLVLQDLDLDLPSGEFISIIGESGSGKTTLLNIIAGNLKPDNGQVLFGETNIYSLSEKELSDFRLFNIGIVYQFFNLIDTLNVKDNIMLVPYLQKNKTDEIKDYYQKIMNLLNIQNLEKKFPSELSGGEQQRVAIARALMHQGDILILDEATGNLDSKNTRIILDILKELHEKLHITIIQVTHSLEVAKAGTLIMEMIDGKLVKTYASS